MLRVFQISLTPDAFSALRESDLPALCEKQLKLKKGSVKAARICREGVDARHGRVSFAVSCECELNQNESKTAARFPQNLCVYVPGRLSDPVPDVFALPAEPWRGERPVVVGMGPAGLFCALMLCARGARPLVLERGQPVERRAADVDAFEAGGELNEESNVLFGEGGAGTFSDGKLTCGLNDPLTQTVLQTFVHCGAPEQILTRRNPHIGTDVLRSVIARMRALILEAGGEVRFGACVTDLIIRDGRVAALKVQSNGSEEEISASSVCLCTGHSARDFYETLHRCRVPMTPKPFAIGLRIEHPRTLIEQGRYGSFAAHPAMPPAEYKLNVHTPDGRGVYTFCMCPGGRVITASHDRAHLNVNGMSLHARDGENSNAALLVGVKPEDFVQAASPDPLDGIRFQQRIEAAALQASGGKLRPLCQRVDDLMQNRSTSAPGSVRPSCLPGVTYGDVRACLPSFVTENLQYALPRLAAQLPGYDLPDALLTAPETRSSSPVRIVRDENGESGIRGIYPLGEGAGYAGGIMSSALDGLKCAMRLQGTEDQA